MTESDQIARAIRHVCDRFESRPVGDFQEGLCARCEKTIVLHWLRTLWEERRVRMTVARTAQKLPPSRGSGPWVRSESF